MIRSVSKTVFVNPDETATFEISLNNKTSEHASFSIESANPGGYWGCSIPQIPKDTKVPSQMIITPFSGVVHLDNPKRILSVKYLYPTWIRVVQYLSAAEKPTVYAKIKLDTKRWTRIKRFWHRFDVERPTERIF